MPAVPFAKPRRSWRFLTYRVRSPSSPPPSPHKNIPYFIDEIGKNKDEMAKNVYTKLAKNLQKSQKSCIFASVEGEDSPTQLNRFPYEDISRF